MSWFCGSKLHLVVNGAGACCPNPHISMKAAMGSRLGHSALDHLRDTAQRRAFDTVVVLATERLACHYAHQWLLVEKLESGLIRSKSNCSAMRNWLANSTNRIRAAACSGT
jgi:hypothetical protein